MKELKSVIKFIEMLKEGRAVGNYLEYPEFIEVKVNATHEEVKEILNNAIAKRCESVIQESIDSAFVFEPEFRLQADFIMSSHEVITSCNSPIGTLKDIQDSLYDFFFSGIIKAFSEIVAMKVDVYKFEYNQGMSKDNYLGTVVFYGVI